MLYIIASSLYNTISSGVVNYMPEAMISYLSHSDIDKLRWDACISHAQYSIIYGYSWYLDMVSPGWDALVDDDYQSVFPLTWKKKFGLYYLSQPNFAQHL